MEERPGMVSQRELQRQKRELTGQLEGLRDSLGRDRATLVRNLNPLSRVVPSLASHPLRTFGIACLGTAVLTMLFRRKPKRNREKKRSTPAKALTAALVAALQPALKHWVAYMVKQRLSERTKMQSTDSLLGP